MLIESVSANAVLWLVQNEPRPWKFQIHFNEITELTSYMDVVFGYDVRSANSMVDVSCISQARGRGQ